ncbi:MAG TPA: sigma-70 family RNA polymerase sigma factor [candidate division Zixibacteria bacterium]|nr:sigma-70 family RNA polymerase sigma factor [candidate division Zixibacteria bacterium]
MLWQAENDNPTEDRIILEENQNPPVSEAGKVASERKLVEAAQNGDSKAFGQLVRLHQKRLFRYIFGLLRSFDTTEDIVQEAFVKAFDNIRTFRAEYAFYPWLSTIARNLAYNHIHRDEKKESLDTLREKGYNPESTELGPIERLLNDESDKRFYKALMALPTKYRTVFVLRHFEDMDYAQIASYLKIPPGTVDSRLYRARQMLMEELKDLIE